MRGFGHAKKIPKCGYTRKENEEAPEYECPRCGIVYEKYITRQLEKYRTQSNDKFSEITLFLPLFAAWVLTRQAYRKVPTSLYRNQVNYWLFALTGFLVGGIPALIQQRSAAGWMQMSALLTIAAATVATLSLTRDRLPDLPIILRQNLRRLLFVVLVFLLTVGGIFLLTQTPEGRAVGRTLPPMPIAAAGFALLIAILYRLVNQVFLRFAANEETQSGTLLPTARMEGNLGDPQKLAHVILYWLQQQWQTEDGWLMVLAENGEKVSLRPQASLTSTLPEPASFAPNMPLHHSPATESHPTPGAIRHDNHGLIGAGTGYAVRLDSARDVGTFTNHAGATMSSNGVAMSVLGVAASIINQGAIEATSSHSVIFDGSADVGLFHNKVGGVIQSAGNANTVTVGVNSSITTLINEGTIENTGPGGALNLIGTVGSFANSGLIHANDLWSLLLNSPNVPDLIVNTGGTISTSGAGSAAVLIFTDLGAAAVTIDGGTLQGDKALWVSAAQTGAITVKNASIVGSVEFSNAEETLNVSGSSLNGDIVFTGTDNNMNFEQGGTTTIAAGTQFINTTFFSLLTGANVVSNSEQSSANSDILKLTMIETLATESIMV